jgi:hypothetical protein
MTSTVRIMRPLCRMKVFDEVGFETYTCMPISKFLTMPSVAGGYKFMYITTLLKYTLSSPSQTNTPQVRRSSQSLRPHANLPLPNLLRQPLRTNRVFPIRLLDLPPPLPLAHGAPRSNGELQRFDDRTTFVKGGMV